MPDITLLAPIARLLQVSLEELLSFREDLTEKEIQELVRELIKENMRQDSSLDFLKDSGRWEELMRK